MKGVDRRKASWFQWMGRAFVAVWLCLTCGPASALAQCAMCRASLANSDDPIRASNAINAGILILLLPTLALIGAITGLVMRYYRADTRNQNALNEE